MASPGSQRLKFSQVYQPQRSDSLHYWDYLLVYSVLGTFPNPPYSNQKSRELFSFHTIFHETTLVKENYTAFLTGSVYARVLPHSGRAEKRLIRNCDLTENFPSEDGEAAFMTPVEPLKPVDWRHKCRLSIFGREVLCEIAFSYKPLQASRKRKYTCVH